MAEHTSRKTHTKIRSSGTHNTNKNLLLLVRDRAFVTARRGFRKCTIDGNSELGQRKFATSSIRFVWNVFSVCIAGIFPAVESSNEGKDQRNLIAVIT